ncbi:hypothetical protein [Thermogemmatispora tikiterensis]|uniref:hypothetical protein n=1 Tax=Thermogemmatispora tikiterensis TaxID=1825093 RepID=UPI0011BFE1DC|nr:hypothetical protein [Thermogemmatispora tikiterensis]
MDVTSQEIPVPVGRWAGAAGQLLLTDVLHGLGALKDSYCARTNTPPDVSRMPCWWRPQHTELAPAPRGEEEQDTGPMQPRACGVSNTDLGSSIVASRR